MMEIIAVILAAILVALGKIAHYAFAGFGFMVGAHMYVRFLKPIIFVKIDKK